MADSIKQKVLFLVPSPSSKGGISNYYSVIKDAINFPYEYFYRGVRIQGSRINKLFYSILILWDYFRFYLKLKTYNYHVVIINTSFGKTGFWRDYFFIRIIKYCKINYIVFFRGIDYDVLEHIRRKWLQQFKRSFLEANKIIVLSKDLKMHLENLGFKNKIEIETTVVDSDFVSGITFNQIINNQKSEQKKILFLSRIEKSKGIFELIAGFKELLKTYPKVSLHICGTGSEIEAVKSLTMQVENIVVKGYVSGVQKRNELATSHLFVLPSFHEGLPNSVIEAMSFGIPVITTPVGGIPEIFEPGVNGILLDSIDEFAICDAMKTLLENEELRIEMAENNFSYAKDLFYKEKVVVRLKDIIEK